MLDFRDFHLFLSPPPEILFCHDSPQLRTACLSDTCQLFAFEFFSQAFGTPLVLFWFTFFDEVPPLQRNTKCPVFH